MNSIRKTITMDLEGKTEHDIELAFAEAVRSIKEGNIVGFDTNDTGGYRFDSKTVYPQPVHSKRRSNSKQR